MKRSESDRSEEGMILGSSDATFVLLRSGFYICAQETVGKVEMVLASKWRQELSECQFIMIDIFLVERKENIYRKDFLLRRVFCIGRKHQQQSGGEVVGYIYVKKKTTQ